MPRDKKFKGEIRIYTGSFLFFAFRETFFFVSIALIESTSTIYTLFLKSQKRSRDPYIENRSVAISATGREQVVIVRLAVRMTLPLEEVPRAQFLVAVGAREVFRMPCLA